MPKNEHHQDDKHHSGSRHHLANNFRIEPGHHSSFYHQHHHKKPSTANHVSLSKRFWNAAGIAVHAVGKFVVSTVIVIKNILNGAKNVLGELLDIRKPCNVDDSCSIGSQISKLPDESPLHCRTLPRDSAAAEAPDVSKASEVFNLGGELDENSQPAGPGTPQVMSGS